MNTISSFNVLESMELVYELSENSKLNSEFFDLHESEIRKLSEYFGVNAVETVLFVVSFVLSFDESSFSSVFKYLGLSDFQSLKYKREVDVLLSKQLIVKKRNRRNKALDYEITQNVVDKIMNNAALDLNHSVPINKSEVLDIVDLLEEFDAKSTEYDCDDLNFLDFQYYLKEMIKSQKQRPLFKELHKMKLELFEIFFILDCIWDCITCGDNDFNTDVQSTINDFYKQKSRTLNTLKMLANGNSKLVKLQLIELSKGQFKNTIKCKLSDKMIDLLRDQEELVFDQAEVDNNKLIMASKINDKQLFYNKEEEKQIQLISSILEQSQFVRLQENLQKQSLPKGIAILLHGEPGTGKTESVYQLAKQSGRNIFKVDISETKSMWFGESQKLVKKIFKDYKHMRNQEKMCPILLFNEADSVIGKRKNAGSSTIADTENAIQNVLLEEIENFEGILFATTNLVDNMDSAFERRFLFKVRFEKPIIENAAKIWKSKLPFLTTKESLELANFGVFSGGEMENITRKIVMEQILNSEEPSFEKVLEFCKQEKWSHDTSQTKIGF